MLERMVFYGQTGRCRWKVLLEPFGEAEGFGTCGHCDNCLRMAQAAGIDDSAAGAAGVEEQDAAGGAGPRPAPPRAGVRAGDAVRVARYGRGIVEAVDGEGVTVRFDEGASRVFLADFVRPASRRGRSSVEARRRRGGPPGCLASPVSDEQRSSARPAAAGAEAQKWPQTLWVVRHGQSSGNVARDAAEAAGLADITIAERDVDVPLSTLGEQQSDALGRWFVELPRERAPTVVLCSPYLRARQTAERVRAAIAAAGGERPAPEMTLDERLREKEFGILDRLTRNGIRARYPELARAARARRQVLFPAAGRRELVRRDPAPAQLHRDGDARASQGARPRRRPPGDRQLPALPARAARRGRDPGDRSPGRRAELRRHLVRVRSGGRPARQAGAAPGELRPAAARRPARR